MYRSAESAAERIREISQFLRSHKETDGRVVAPLSLELGRLITTYGDAAEAHQALAVASSESARLGDRPLERTSLISIAELQFREGKTADAMQTIRLVERSCAGESDSLDCGRSFLMVARCLLTGGRLAEAKQRLNDVLKLMRNLGERRGEMEALIMLSVAEEGQSNLEAANRCLEESAAVEKEIGDPEARVVINNNLALLLRREGRYSEALSMLRHVLMTARTMADPGFARAVAHNMSLLLRDLGNYERSLQYFTIEELESALDYLEQRGADRVAHSSAKVVTDYGSEGYRAVISAIERKSEADTGRVRVERLGEQTDTAIVRGGPLYEGAKRVIDVVGAGLLLLIVAPLLLVVAVAIKLASPGPVLFRQERVGFGGRTFEVLKFRTMRADSESAGNARWAAAGDTRITKVGKFLRRTSIDELPQLINVLRGEMSLIGPRPERPAFRELLNSQFPLYGLRLRVKPGVTGWAQIHRDYGFSLENFRLNLQYDLFYVKNRSLWLDLRILMKTVVFVLRNDAAR
jgi:lipopolysaccharide/colanic/teichoic acid biosynthesis glycosyltransferase/tetratricopeptide (TPR) repeat protein